MIDVEAQMCKCHHLMTLSGKSWKKHTFEQIFNQFFMQNFEDMLLLNIIKHKIDSKICVCASLAYCLSQGTPLSVSFLIHSPGFHFTAKQAWLVPRLTAEVIVVRNVGVSVIVGSMFDISLHNKCQECCEECQLWISLCKLCRWAAARVEAWEWQGVGTFTRGGQQWTPTVGPFTSAHHHPGGRLLLFPVADTAPLPDPHGGASFCNLSMFVV